MTSPVVEQLMSSAKMENIKRETLGKSITKIQLSINQPNILPVYASKNVSVNTTHDQCPSPTGSGPLCFHIFHLMNHTCLWTNINEAERPSYVCSSIMVPWLLLQGEIWDLGANL